MRRISEVRTESGELTTNPLETSVHNKPGQSENVARLLELGAPKTICFQCPKILCFRASASCDQLCHLISMDNVMGVVITSDVDLMQHVLAVIQAKDEIAAFGTLARA